MTGLAIRIAFWVASLVAGAAAFVALIAAAEARSVMEAPLGGVDPSFSAAAGIFGENLRLAVGGLAACALARAPLALKGHPAPLRLLGRTGQSAALLYMFLLLAVNVLAIGALIGAYGSAGMRSLLPHAPVELIAFSLLGALFVRSLHPAPVRAREACGALAGVLALLAAAAGIELIAV